MPRTNQYSIYYVDPLQWLLEKQTLGGILQERENFGQPADYMYRNDPEEFWNIYRPRKKMYEQDLPSYQTDPMEESMLVSVLRNYFNRG